MGHFLSLLQCHHGCIKGKTCNLPLPQCNSELPHSRPSFRFFEEFGFLVVSNPARWSLSFILGPLHWLSSYLQDLQQKSVFSFYPLELTCCKLLSPLSLLLLFSTKRGGGDPADINIGPCGVSRGQSWVPCSINVVRTHICCASIINLLVLLHCYSCPEQ